MKSSNVCILTRSSVASPLFKGLATKRTTVKWTTAPLITLKSQSRYNQKEKQMNICNLFGEEVDAKAYTTTPKGKESNFRSRLLDLRISGIITYITVRKRHSGCNQFISFTRLTFTSKGKKERTDPNEKRKPCKLNEFTSFL